MMMLIVNATKLCTNGKGKEDYAMKSENLIKGLDLMAKIEITKL